MKLNIEKIAEAAFIDELEKLAISMRPLTNFGRRFMPMGESYTGRNVMQKMPRNIPGDVLHEVTTRQDDEEKIAEDKWMKIRTDKRRLNPNSFMALILNKNKTSIKQLKDLRRYKTNVKNIVSKLIKK